MVEEVRRYCQARKMQYVHDDAPTCLPSTVLRDMVKTFQIKAVNNADREAFRPYASHGGRDGANNHRTKAGLLRTVKQALNDMPEETWITSDVDQGNPYLYALQLRQPHQSDALAHQLSQKYFKPNIVATDEKDFGDTLLSTEQIQSAIANTTALRRSFAFLGAQRPVVAGTQQLLFRLHLLWAVREGQRSPRRRYKSFGVVWNTSTHPAGSHWVTALFFPNERRYEYFDSLGYKPNAAVGCQMKLIKQQLAGLAGFANRDWIGRYSDTKHQKGGVQCGMYAIWYIHERVVRQRSFETVAAHPMHDADICALRPQHFALAHSRIRRAIQEREEQIRQSMVTVSKAKVRSNSRQRRQSRQPKQGRRKEDPIVLEPDEPHKGRRKEDPIVLEARQYTRRVSRRAKPSTEAQSTTRNSRIRIRARAGGVDPDAQDNDVFHESRCPLVVVQQR